jgi:predicted phosphodiesterase
MAASRPTMRRTRFVCVSDTHNAAPGGPFKLPKGDVLIHAGDMTNQGSLKELQRAVHWIEAAEFERKIIIAGMLILSCSK